jgi:hypothetical protein
MQTYIIDFNLKKSFRYLDIKRHNKQIVECIQILLTLSEMSTGWCYHPIMKMWRGFEGYLVKKYLKTAIIELERKRNKIYDSYRNSYRFFYGKYVFSSTKKPVWLNEQFILSHRSRLVEKDMEHYQPLFGINPGLQYIWNKKQVFKPSLTDKSTLYI